MEYDQRVIIRFLANEGADARQIADRLQAQFTEDSYQLRTVQFWLAEIRRGRQDLHDEIRNRRPPLDDLDSKILAILEKSPFELSRSIAERLLVSHSAVLRHLRESIGFKSFHLR
jgi:transposase